MRRAGSRSSCGLRIGRYRFAVGTAEDARCGGILPTLAPGGRAGITPRTCSRDHQLNSGLLLLLLARGEAGSRIARSWAVFVVLLKVMMTRCHLSKDVWSHFEPDSPVD